MTLTEALRAELLQLLRADPDVRGEIRALLGDGEVKLALTIKEAAELAGSSPRTVARWIKAGDLPATGEHKATRILRRDLLALLERGRRQADNPEDLADQEDGQ